MNKVAKFEKVTFEQFRKDWYKVKPKYMSDEDFEDFVVDCYENIKLPERATKHSAGYDFFTQFTIEMNPGESVVIPTGIRCSIDDGWVLKIYPRSGHGFKYGVHLSNTVGIVDGDFFYADNEGHIHVKLTNDSALATTVEIEYNKAFCQGIFVPYGITVDDNADRVRSGGFGSTDK